MQDLRHFEPADREAVLRLLAACGLPTSDLTQESPAQFIVGRRNGEIVGTVAVEPYGEDALLRSFAVRGDWRGLGVGAGLVQAIMAAARPRFRALYLLTTTAAPYFAQHGWRKVERAAAPEAVRASTEFSELCPSSSTCMVKTLD